MEKILRNIDERIFELLSAQNTGNCKEVEFRIEELIRIKGKIANEMQS